MSTMRKMFWSKLRMCYGKKGEGEEDVNSQKGSQKGKSRVDEEYNEAFRTKSYTELCNKVQDQLETRTCLNEGQSVSPSSSATPVSSPHSPSHMQNAHLSECLLEPPQETLTPILENSHLHRFLINYFETSQEAGKICEFVLQNAHQMGVINHRTLKNVIKLIDQFPDCTSWTHNQYDMLYRNLASFATHNNPFTSTPEKFTKLHDTNVQLLHQLTSKYKKTTRRTKFIKWVKRSSATFLVVGSTALAVTLLVLAANTMVGMVAAPGLIMCTLGFLTMRKLKGQKRKLKRTRLEGLGAQLDTAARGVYTLINDFDTMGQLVKGLHDEMERRTHVAKSCVEKGKSEMLKEVVKEFQMHESCFMEQLEELEKHICLSFLNINRARRLLVQEMV